LPNSSKGLGYVEKNENEEDAENRRRELLKKRGHTLLIYKMVKHI
jgi:dsRNA-specific ribonuclease